jgi:hypothetical protein
MSYFQFGMTVDSFLFAEDIAYFLLNQFIAYLMVQYGNPNNRSQDLIFKLLIGQVFRANPDETPPAEILKKVIDRIAQVSEIRQTTQVLGPLITDVEGILEENMDDLDILDRQIVVDETGIDEQDAEIFTLGSSRRELDWDRLRNYNDDYDSILIQDHYI